MTYDPKSFERSLQAFLVEPEAGFKMGQPVPLGDDPLVRAALRPCLEVSSWQAHSAVDALLRRVQSPIERVMGLALLGVAGRSSSSIILGINHVRYHPHANVHGIIRIEAQHKIGKYTADFLVTFSDIPFDPESRGGREVSVASTLVVECDGHDFHELTKEQATRDKKRDRALQDAGHVVHRFSGADIYRDPFKCAWESFQGLYSAQARLCAEIRKGLDSP